MFERTVIEETRLNKTEYLIDPEAPVERETRTERVYFEDKSGVIPFSEQEVIGEWAMPIDAYFAEAEAGQQDVSCGFNWSSCWNDHLRTDLAFFYENFTGKTSRTDLSFTWSIDSAGALMVVFTDQETTFTITKHRDYAEFIGVHVEALMVTNT